MDHLQMVICRVNHLRLGEQGMQIRRGAWLPSLGLDETGAHK